MRQRGDTSWATHLNALRDCRDPIATTMADVALASRKARSCGGTVDDAAPEWRDAVHLYPKNNLAKAHNYAKLCELQGQGHELVTLHAAHAQLLEHGVVSHQPFPHRSLPDNTDDCGGLDQEITLCEGARVMCDAQKHHDL